MTEKAIGQRGSWFATVQGESLPCVHKHWFTRGRYHDPHLKPGWPPADALAEAIKAAGRVVLTDDEVATKEDGTPEFRRSGYIAVWSTADLHFDENGLQFRFVNRLINVK